MSAARCIWSAMIGPSYVFCLSDGIFILTQVRKLLMCLILQSGGAIWIICPVRYERQANFRRLLQRCEPSLIPPSAASPKID